MMKIAASSKFQELMKKFNMPPPNEHKQRKKQAEKDIALPNERKQCKKPAEKDNAPPNEHKPHDEQAEKDDAPPNEHKPHDKQAENDDAPPIEYKLHREQTEKNGEPSNEQKRREKQAEKDDASPGIRKSARDMKQPQRYESPTFQSRPKLSRGTPVVRKPNRARETARLPPKGPSRPKVSRQEPNQSTTRPPKDGSQKPEGSARNRIDREKPAHRSAANPPKRARCQEESDSDDFLDFASGPQSPPHGSSAFSRAASRQVDRNIPSRAWSDSQFLEPPLPFSREPRLRNTNKTDTSRRRELTTTDFDRALRDPNPMYSRTEVSMRRPMICESHDALMRPPIQARNDSTRQVMHSRNPQKRQPMHARNISIRHNIAGPDVSNFGYQPFERQTDLSRTRDFTHHLENEFRRPQTPPEAQDLVRVEEAKLKADIIKMINSPYFTSLELVYGLNSIQDTIVSKMERFCRKRGITESLLRNTLQETMQETIGADWGKVDAWLDSVTHCEKRPRLDPVFDCPRY